MRRQITFKPALRAGETPREITGEETAYGLVLHPAIGNEQHPNHWPTHYAISDPETGALVLQSHGRMETLSELIRHAAISSRLHRPGGFRAVLETCRDIYRRTTPSQVTKSNG